MDLASARARLGARQAELLTALVAGGTDPAGFERGALAATRHALIDKRRVGVARHWPALAAEPGFAAGFADWAAGRPPAGSHADGLAYGLAHRHDLSTSARVTLLLAQAAGHRFAAILDRNRVNGSLLALRAPALGSVVLRSPARRPGSRRDTDAGPTEDPRPGMA